MKLKNKSQAVLWFGSNQSVAAALGIAKSSFSEWPEKLTQRQVNELLGAAVSSGLAKFVPLARIRRMEE